MTSAEHNIAYVEVKFTRYIIAWICGNSFSIRDRRIPAANYASRCSPFR